MATQIMGPLASQLFQLGQGDSGSFRLGSYNVQAAPPPKLPQKQSSGGGAAGALANVAGVAASAYMGSQSGAAPVNESGNGFGLGGNVVSGDVGSADYAGTQKASISSLFSSPEPVTPVDNGYRSSSPYGLDYGEMKTKSPSLFTYGGSYGGATY